MDWLKKIAGYAPDIAAAVASGGATLPATALRIVSKELLGYETDNAEIVGKAVNSATPEQMIALTKCNNDFITRKLELQYQELANQRADTQDARKQNKGHWMTWVLPLSLLAFSALLSYGLMKIAIPEENRDIVFFIVGQVFALTAAGVTYWVGSSRGSAEKAREIGALKNKSGQ